MIQQIIRIDGNVQWKVIRTSNDNWVAACDPLRITLQSETWAELMEDMALSIDAIFKEMLKSNELDKFLRDHGWTTTSPIPSRTRNVRFDVPFFPTVVVENAFQKQLYQ